MNLCCDCEHSKRFVVYNHDNACRYDIRHTAQDLLGSRLSGSIEPQKSRCIYGTMLQGSCEGRMRSMHSGINLAMATLI